MEKSAEYTHLTASSSAFREPMAHIAGEVANTFSASIAAGAKSAYSCLSLRNSKLDIFHSSDTNRLLILL